MNSLTNVILSLIFLLIGFITVYIMLTIQGDPKNRTNLSALRNAHKIMGYIFLLILMIMFILMVKKISFSGHEFSSLISLHIMLSVIVFPIIIIKILIARGFKKFYPLLSNLGLIVFFLSFTLVIIAAGPYLLKLPSKTTPLESTQRTVAKILEKKPTTTAMDAEKLISAKCSNCHTLERVRQPTKTPKEWEETIKKMIKYSQDPKYLSNEEVSGLVYYLTGKTQ